MNTEIEGYWDETPEWREAYRAALKELDEQYPIALAIEPVPVLANGMYNALANMGALQQGQLVRVQNLGDLQNMGNQSSYYAMMNNQMQNQYDAHQQSGQFGNALGGAFSHLFRRIL